MEQALRKILAPTGSSAITAATTIYSNDFEIGIADWNSFGGLFIATRVPSGTNGIVSASGRFHAETSGAGAASRWGGFNFGAGHGVPTRFHDYTTSLAIYLDVSGRWANDTRFDFDSAINNAAGHFLCDFIFNAGFFTDSDGGPGSGIPRFVISASTTGQPDGTHAKNPANDPVAITNSGWHTLEHHFHDDAGFLTVDMSIFDPSHTLVHAWIVRTTERIAATGGNSYGWFNHNQFPILAFDNAELRLNPMLDHSSTAVRNSFGSTLRRRAVA